MLVGFMFMARAFPDNLHYWSRVLVNSSAIRNFEFIVSKIYLILAFQVEKCMID